jgi:hypothetical protein
MTDSPRQSKPPQDENPWRVAGLVTAIGAELAVFIGLGWWLGSIYDDRNGTGYGSLAGLLVGLAAGIGMVAAMLRKFTGGRGS